MQGFGADPGDDDAPDPDAGVVGSDEDLQMYESPDEAVVVGPNEGEWVRLEWRADAVPTVGDSLLADLSGWQ